MYISRTPPPSANKAEPTLALKLRGDVTRSQKQGYQWPHKWTCVQNRGISGPTNGHVSNKNFKKI